MAYTFPDSASVLMEVIEDFGLSAYFFLPADFEQSLPAVHISKTGGTASGPLASDRIQVVTYGNGRDEALETAEAVRGLLQDRFHSSETYGLVDTVRVESLPADLPYPSQSIRAFISTYRAETRAKKGS